MRRAALLLVATIFACALLASHQRKPFPLLIDEAHATSIVCNPTIPRDIKAERFKGVQKT